MLGRPVSEVVACVNYYIYLVCIFMIVYIIYTGFVLFQNLPQTCCLWGFDNCLALIGVSLLYDSDKVNKW